MPRDPKRIARLLGLIEKIWTKHSDLRLMQLLGNAVLLRDAYYLEDDALEQRILEFYANIT